MVVDEDDDEDATVVVTIEEYDGLNGEGGREWGYVQLYLKPRDKALDALLSPQ